MNVALHVLVSLVIIWVGITDMEPLFMAFLLSSTHRWQKSQFIQTSIHRI
jgi:hypothetical protein